MVKELISSAEILQNKKARELAEEIFKLCQSELTLIAPDAEGRFWERLGKLVASKLVAPNSDVREMSDEEALAFEKELVPFGVYAGRKVGDVPFDYWLAITESKFNLKLVRYIRSRHFQERQEREHH